MTKPKEGTVTNKLLTKARVVCDQIAKSIEDVYSIIVLADTAQIPNKNVLVYLQNFESFLIKIHEEQNYILDALMTSIVLMNFLLTRLFPSEWKSRITIYMLSRPAYNVFRITKIMCQNCPIFQFLCYQKSTYLSLTLIYLHSALFAIHSSL